MNKESIEKFVIEKLDELNTNDITISINTDLEDIEIESIKILKMLSLVKTQYDIKFTIKNFMDCETVSDIINIINDKINNHN